MPLIPAAILFPTGRCMADQRDMVSVGIDIGTTTTQIIFSQLSLVNVARAGQIPRIDIRARCRLHELAGIGIQ